jgi:serine/threonine-protein kinase
MRTRDPHCTMVARRLVSLAMVQIGAILAGTYRVKRILGQGGMGVVVGAVHLKLNQPVG